MMRRGSRRPRPWWRSLFDGLVVVLIAAAIIAASELIAPGDVTSNMTVVDGDSLRAPDGSNDIRLHGIDAPELGQMCSDAAGMRYDCGRRARSHLRSLISGRQVTCRTLDIDRYGRSVATCFAGDVDLNKHMVEDGWALAYRQHTGAYVAAEVAARDKRSGMWSGTFDPPELWRNLHRSDGGASGRPD